MAEFNDLLKLTPVAEAEKAPMQKLFVAGHLLPGVNFDTKTIRGLIDKFGQATKMNIFNGPHIKTPQDFDPETYRRLGGKAPEDINVSWMWDDSGGSIYVFPTKDNWCVIDIHTCKNFDPGAVLQVAYQELHFREDMQFAEQTHLTSTPWRPFSKEGGKILTPEVQFFPELSEILKVNLTDLNQVIQAGQKLETIVLQAIKEGWGERLAAVFKPEIAQKLREIHSVFEVTTDDRFMQAILDGKATSPDQCPFQPLYDRLAKMEAEAATMKQGKQIMHIGTGWPGTAIGLNKLGIPVTCVEINPVVAKKSKVALEKLGLIGKDKLQVVNYDGTKLNPEDFEVVIISAMVPTNDKEKILWNLRRLATEEFTETETDPITGPLVILRTPPDRARTLLYQALPAKTLEGYGLKLKNKTTPGVEDPLQSLIFQVYPTASARRGDGLQLEAARSELSPPEKAVIV